MFKNLHVIEHPLVTHRLNQIRDIGCAKATFASNTAEISRYLAYEASRDLPMAEQKIQTPVSDMRGKLLSDDKPVVVPVLRAGLGMLSGVESVYPNASIGHIGLFRDEETLEPHQYYVRLPDLESRTIFLIDPMLATGCSAVKALDILIAEGADRTRLKFLCLLAAPEGMEMFNRDYADIPVYTAALDDKLNEKAYIVPGLGDAGDRLHGTTE